MKTYNIDLAIKANSLQEAYELVSRYAGKRALEEAKKRQSSIKKEVQKESGYFTRAQRERLISGEASWDEIVAENWPRMRADKESND